MAIRLIKKISYTGKIEIVTGLHIGGSNTALGIGGPDKLVLRNPIDNIPYIPGSSLKGKMRSLIEIYYSESLNGKPSSDPQSRAGNLFGVSASDKGHPSRIIIRDCFLHTKKWEEDFKEGNLDLPYTESKTETDINRITAGANPRTIERIPAGAQFTYNFILNIFEGESEETLKGTLDKAMELLEDDYLGGNGSRGYGQIRFIEKKQEEKTY